MATLKSKPTSDQLRKARKGGLRAKRPNKPRAGASLSIMENWVSRYNDWVGKVHDAIKKDSQKESDKKKRENLKKSIRER